MNKNKNYIFDEVDIDVINRIVSFKSTFTNNKIKKTIDDVECNIYSMFNKRVYDSNINPVLCALRGLGGWKFSGFDINIFLQQFVYSIDLKSKYDTIITVPSADVLNMNFIYRLEDVIESDHKISNEFKRLKSNVVYNNYIDWDLIEFHKLNIKHGDVDAIMNDYFVNMKNNNCGVFSYKYITNPVFRKYIKTNAGTIKDIDVFIHANKINNKNILILDDTSGSNSVVSDVATNVLKTFVPKTVDVITLFSKAEK